MTCIVGVVDGGSGHVLIGGDSAGTADGQEYMVVRKDPKVFSLALPVKYATENHDLVASARCVLGYAGSFRCGQILRYFMMPPMIAAEEDQHEYLVKRFVPQLRETLSQQGYLKTENGRSEGGSFLIGLPPLNGARGRLFSIMEDHQVSENLDGHDASGGGWQPAVGSLDTSVGDSADKRVESALRASERWAKGVRAPFYVESTDQSTKVRIIR